ncbi:MAG: DUF2399 domain-containing protein, partial [Chloroflexota bacterium]
TSLIRRRRTRADIDAIKDAMAAVLTEQRPMTVRQVFYQLVPSGVIEKTEREYKQTVCRLLAEMRLEGTVPFGWIADSTRWMRKPRTFDSAEDALLATARLYRRSVWRDQHEYVEVWLEKDALAGVLYAVTGDYDVPLMVTRGYASLSLLHEAAEAIAAQGKPTTIYYFGDLDPSGVDIARNVEERLTEFAPKADITFERVAVTPEQVDLLGLPTRPTKMTDSRSRNFHGDSVEVDAISATTLREMARTSIEAHIEPETLRAIELAEASERSILMDIARTMRAGGAT